MWDGTLIIWASTIPIPHLLTSHQEDMLKLPVALLILPCGEIINSCKPLEWLSNMWIQLHYCMIKSNNCEKEMVTQNRRAETDIKDSLIVLN